MKKSPVILIVEDNPGDVRLIKEALKETAIHATLHILKDGSVAMKYLDITKKESFVDLPSLILLDLNLPRKSGLEVLAHIKGDETLKKIPVIVLSSSQNPDDIGKAYDLHANCYLTKPVDFEPFINIVKAIEYFWLQLAKLPFSIKS